MCVSAEQKRSNHEIPIEIFLTPFVVLYHEKLSLERNILDN